MHGAARVVLAVPVAPPGWEARIGAVADELVRLATPAPFLPLGSSTPTSRRQPMTRWPPACSAPPPPACSPTAAAASRHSPRNRYVATVLNQAGLGILLFDLLTQHEELDRPTCSTSACSPGASPTSPYGCAPSPPRRACLSATSAPAPAPPPRCGPPPNPVASRPWLSRGGRPDLARPSRAALRNQLAVVPGDTHPTPVGHRQQLVRSPGARRRAFSRDLVMGFGHGRVLEPVCQHGSCGASSRRRRRRPTAATAGRLPGP